MGGGCCSTARPDVANQETGGLFLSGLLLKTSLVWLKLPGACTPVSTALGIIEPHKPVTPYNVLSMVEELPLNDWHKILSPLSHLIRSKT